MYVLFGLLFLLGGGALLVFGLRSREPRPDRPVDYLQSLGTDPNDFDDFEQLLQEPFIQRVLRPVTSAMVGTASGVLPRNLRDDVHQRLVLAGMANQYRAEEVVTAQVLGGIAGLILAIFLIVTGVLESNLGLLALILLPILGAQAPRSIINSKATERQESIQKDLPDTLDLLAISVEAGVGFEAALGIVAENFDSALAEEFTRTIHEMELGLPRRQALENLKRRTDVPDLANFILVLVQADALGMPIGRVLKTQAEEMRKKRRQWAREKAAKLPVKIMIPLMPILMSIFIVILGPSVSQIMDAF